MAKLRLLVWTAALGCAATVLLSGMGWPPTDDPAVAMMAVVRIVAGALAAYLCVATIVAVRLPRVAPRFVRQLVATAIGGGLLVTPMVASAEVPVLHRVPPAPARAETTPAVTPAAPAPAPAPPPTRNAVEGEIVVAPGDHLWRIAERTVSARIGRAPTDEEIAPYWRVLITANLDRLVHRDDPDLILPGQVLRLPS